MTPKTQKLKASTGSNCRGRPLPFTSIPSREIACSICGIDRPDNSAISAIPNVLIRPSISDNMSVPTICQDGESHLDCLGLRSLSTARTAQCYALAGRKCAFTGGIHESHYSVSCVHHFCGIAGRGRQGGGRPTAVGLSGE